jgi:hypothetical protein
MSSTGVPGSCVCAVRQRLWFEFLHSLNIVPLNPFGIIFTRALRLLYDSMKDITDKKEIKKR